MEQKNLINGAIKLPAMLGSLTFLTDSMAQLIESATTMQGKDANRIQQLCFFMQSSLEDAEKISEMLCEHIMKEQM